LKIKLKVEFIVLNQLTCLVQPNSDFFVYLGDPTLTEPSASRKRTPRLLKKEVVKVEGPENRRRYLPSRSLSEDLVSRHSSAESEEHAITPPRITFQSDLCRPQARHLQDIGSLVPLKASLTTEVDRQERGEWVDLERRYLGQFGG
jgi:hypothetical protein